MANDLFTIPVQNVPQRFEIELLAVTYIIENRWNAQGGYWELDWYDANGLPLVMAVPVLGGVDMLDPYPELPPGIMAVLTDGDEGIDPTLDGLGIESLLYYLTP
jgi:hypothetical protein